MVGIIDRGFLTAATARWAFSAAAPSMLLRGSFVTGLWVGTHLRNCEDLDFVVVSHNDPMRAQTDLCAALAVDLDDGYRFHVDQSSSEDIFADTPFPGLRIVIPCTKEQNSTLIQFDIGFNDPIPLEPEVHPVGVSKVEVATIAKELGYAWKLHGVIEREGLSWRPKDMADLWLMQRHSMLDTQRLGNAIQVAMDSRDAPMWRLDRLLNKRMGRSSGSRRRWRKYVDAHPESNLPESILEVVDEVAAFVRPIVHSSCSDPLPAKPPSRAEMRAVCNDHSSIRCYQWESGHEVFVCERAGSREFPALECAETNAKHRLWQNRREARGITFGIEGELLARPYAQFESFSRLEESQFRNAEVLEKLDGSLVFPTPMGKGYVLRTRRRQSEIADAAMRFAEANSGDYQGLIESCMQLGQTPLFEWCSRSRLIVFDHPNDRLVLTGIRNHESGRLVTYESMSQTAANFDIECVQRLQPKTDLANWVEQVEGWTDREGCIIRLEDGMQFKVKSNRYLWLHRAIEGPQRDRARWYLVLSGAADQLYQCSAGRGMNLSDYAGQVEAAIANYAEEVCAFVKPFRLESPDNRRRLADRIRNERKLFQRLAFAAFTNEDVRELLAGIVLSRCEDIQSFKATAALLNGPLWND